MLERIDGHTAQTWEELVGRYLLRLHGPRGYRLVGPAIRSGEEIDVVLLNRTGGKAVLAEAKWRDATPREIEALRRRALRKAALILPQEVEIEKIYVAVRRVKGKPPRTPLHPAR